MGNLCGSPSKDRDYEDNSIEKRGQAKDAKKQQSENLPQAKMEIVDKKGEKEFSTKQSFDNQETAAAHHEVE